MRILEHFPQSAVAVLPVPANIWKNTPYMGTAMSACRIPR